MRMGRPRVRPICPGVGPTPRSEVHPRLCTRSLTREMH